MKPVLLTLAALGILTATAGVFGYATEGRGQGTARIVQGNLETFGSASSGIVSTQGVSAQVVSADTHVPYIALKFWSSAPAEGDDLVLDTEGVSWNGNPVDVRGVTTGMNPVANIELPEWEPGTHTLIIERFGRMRVDGSRSPGDLAGEWVVGPWVIDVTLGPGGDASPRRTLVAEPAAPTFEFEVISTDVVAGRWVVTLGLPDDRESAWVSIPAFLELENGDLVLPESVEGNSSATRIAFAVDEALTSATLVVSAWVEARSGTDMFVLTRSATGDWTPESEGIAIVEDSSLFGLSIEMDEEDHIFSAFGDPILVDDVGNAYTLDWRRVGFGKPDPSAPYVIASGVSYVRFVGPVDPAARELRLTGGPGGELRASSADSSPRIELRVDQ